MNSLAARLKALKDAGKLSADDESTELQAPATSEQLQAAEAALGFKLPPIIKDIYVDVANGGFGYSYGLLGIGGGATNEDGHDAVDLYLRYREPDPDDPHWSWPERLLPLNHLGCAMYLCVDCSRQELPVIWFEPNPHEYGQTWADSFIPLSESFEELMKQWLAGDDPFARLAADT